MKPRLQISKIDWNEVVPLLPKKMRDDLYLEAIVMLAESDTAAMTEEAVYTKHKTMRQRRKQYRRGNGSLPKRLWKQDHPNELLALKGRRFKICKDAKKQKRLDTKAGRLWDKLIQSRSDYITREGLYSLAKGFDLAGAAVVSHLWSNRQIDVAEEPEKTAAAVVNSL